MLFFIPISLIFAQKKEFEKAKRIDVGKYEITAKEEEKFVRIEMKIGEFEVQNPWAIEVLLSKKIDSVHLVYTDFPKNMDFTQLNRNRFERLFKLFPELKHEHYIKWSIFRQIDCNTLEEASALFHGFVVFYKDQLKPHLDPIFQAQKKEFLEKKFERLALQKVGMGIGQDSTTLKVFYRNAKDWKNIVIISDWTASMYPYTLQVLKWQIEENAHERILGYVFFNDGDWKKTSEKKIGSTGGIYQTPNTQVYTVFNYMQKVKNKGDGGDIMENDIEAILLSQEAYPEAEEFILIADNLSSVRDMSLLKNVKKPVRIVLNRLNKGNVKNLIHPHYIEIALATKGVIHTEDADYTTREAIEALKKKEK
ncbi:MAG: hypothetical protein OHK0038_17510 [Flammeovirgaceae bacterium]